MIGLFCIKINLKKKQSTCYSFLETFVIKKLLDADCWVITNDILQFFKVKDDNHPKLEAHEDNEKKNVSYSSIAAKNQKKTEINPTNQTNQMINKENLVPHPINSNMNHNNNHNNHNNNNNNNNIGSSLNDRKVMIDKFYHDSSYQKFNNDFAIFIRGVPNTINHSDLQSILMNAMLNNKSEHISINDIGIDYIDVNYRKSFAFVYLSNFVSFNIAIQLRYIYIHGYLCGIQKKISDNGPRKFPTRSAKQ